MYTKRTFRLLRAVRLTLHPQKALFRGAHVAVPVCAAKRTKRHHALLTETEEIEDFDEEAGAEMVSGGN